MDDTEQMRESMEEFEAAAKADLIETAGAGMSALLGGAEALEKAKTDETMLWKPCRSCGQSTETTVGLWELFGVVCCHDCQLEFDRRERAKRRSQSGECSAWLEICPPRYRQSREDWAGYPADLWEKWGKWLPIHGRGIAIYGETGKGKSCLMMLFAKRFCEAGLKVKVIWAEELSELANQASRNGNVASIIRGLCNCDCLLMDDPFLHGAKDKRSSEFFSQLVDYVQRWDKSIIVTSQLSGDEYAQSALEGYDYANDTKKRVEAMRRKLGMIVKEDRIKLGE